MDEARYREHESALWRSLDAAPDDARVELASTGTEVRVQSYGDGPPVLFIHGGSTCGTSWAPLVAGVHDRRCLVLDRPGCGLSEPLPQPFAGVDELVEFAGAFVPDVLDALDVERASVVSTSFGAFFAFHSAAAHPARVDRVLEFGWPFGAPIETVPLVMRIASAKLLNHLLISVPPTTATVKAIFRQIGLRDALAAGRVSEESIRWFRSMLRDTDTLRNELRTNPPIMRPVGGLNEDVLFDDDVLGAITVPVAFAWGDRDPFGGRQTAETFSGRIPDAALTVLDGMGHAPWLDDPDRCAAIASDVLSA